MVEEEGTIPQAAAESPRGADGEGQEVGYWARRLGSRAVPAPAAAPAPPASTAAEAPAAQPARAPHPGGTDPRTAEAVLPPLDMPPPAPANGPGGRDSRSVSPGPKPSRSGRTVYYGPYRAHNARKNWIIGGAAAALLLVATIGGALSARSNITSTFDSLTALPSSGSHTIAWYWSTQLGSTSATARPLNVANSDFTTMVTSVQDESLAYFVALDHHGDAWIWGRPAEGRSLQLSEQPTAVTMPPGVRFTAVSTSDGYIVAIDQNGHLWAWGDTNAPGEAGAGAAVSGSTASVVANPVAVATPPGVTFKVVSVGPQFSIALDANGHAWSWGTNEQGDLGLTTDQTFVNVPTEVGMPPGTLFTGVAAGLSHVVALDSNGRIWSWGDDDEGDLGVDLSSIPNAAGSCQAVTGEACTAAPLLVATQPGVTFTSVAASAAYSAAVDSTGRIWTWGTNNDGALGLGDSATTCAAQCETVPGQRPTPATSVPRVVGAPAGVHFVAVAVTPGQQFLDVDDTVALDGRGRVWGWGSNVMLQVGSGTKPCFSTVGQPGVDAAGAALCVLAPEQLPLTTPVRFKGVAASEAAAFGFPT